MKAEQPRYVAYLLRLWQVRDGAQMIWRASLESSHTGARYGFASLDELFGFLLSETSSPCKRHEPSPGPPGPKLDM